MDDFLKCSPKTRRANIPTESATAREFRKWHVYLKVVGVYNEIRQRSCLIQSIGDEVVRVFTLICNIVIHTYLGKAADDILALGVRQVNVATMRISSPVPRIRESLTRTKEQITRGLIRYFPPFVLARWSVEFTLAMLCLILAFVRDLYRAGDHENQDLIYTEEIDNTPIPVRKMKIVRRTVYYYEEEEEADETPTMPNEVHNTIREVHSDAEIFTVYVPLDWPAPAPEGVQPALEIVLDENWPPEMRREGGNVHRKDKNLADNSQSFNGERYTNAFLLNECCSFIKPMFVTTVLGSSCFFFMIAVCAAHALSKKVHNISGGFDPETPEDRKERREMLIRLIGCRDDYRQLGPLPPDQWLVDIVINKYVGSMMNWVVIGPIIGFFVGRPLNIIANLSAAIKEMVYARIEIDDSDNNENQDPDKTENGPSKDNASPRRDEMNSSPVKSSPSKSIVAEKNKSPAKTSSTSQKKDASMTEISNRTNRKSGVLATSTPKATTGPTGKRGTRIKVKINDTNPEKSEPIILEPLSPEKLKQIKTRDPIQAAVIRMKGDKIIEFRRKLRERKQEQKSYKTKNKMIKNANNGYDIIYENPESTRPSTEFDVLKIDCEDNVAPNQPGARQEHRDTDQQHDSETFAVVTEHKVDYEEDYAYEQEHDSKMLVVDVPAYAIESHIIVNDSSEVTAIHVSPKKSPAFHTDVSNSPIDAGQTGVFDSARYKSLTDFPKTINPLNTSDAPMGGDLKKVDNSPRDADFKSIESSEYVQEDFENIGLKTNSQNIEPNDIVDNSASLGYEDLSKSPTETRISRNLTESKDFLPLSPKMTTTTKSPLSPKMTTTTKSPLSPKMTTTTKSPLSPKMKEHLEAEDGVRSSSVDTGQSIAGW